MTRFHRLAFAAAAFAILMAGAPQLSAATSTKSKSKKSTKSTSKKTTPPKGVIDYKKLLDPSKLTAKAPDAYKVRFDTTRGPFVIEVRREWAPHGADRFYNLVTNGYYDEVRFFRVISGFIAQFGINGNPAVNQACENAANPDDPVTQSNTRGMVSFAMRGPNTRTTQIFLNYCDQNARLDSMGFAPFGKVIEWMDIIDSLNAE